jgi:hypothetical protein
LVSLGEHVAIKGDWSNASSVPPWLVCPELRGHTGYKAGKQDDYREEAPASLHGRIGKSLYSTVEAGPKRCEACSGKELLQINRRNGSFFASCSRCHRARPIDEEDTCWPGSQKTVAAFMRKRRSDLSKKPAPQISSDPLDQEVDF